MFNFIKKIKEKRRIKKLSKILFEMQKLEHQIGIDFRESFNIKINMHSKNNKCN